VDPQATLSSTQEHSLDIPVIGGGMMGFPQLKSQVLEIHMYKEFQVVSQKTCNPSYSGGRDQEDWGSKPAWANSFTTPYLKKTLLKQGLVEWLKE
jgi:hypothetical protein